MSLIRKAASDNFSVVAGWPERISALWHNPLYSNAAYIMSANATTAVVGFVFWIVVARLYSTEDVGLGSALLSAAQLLAMLSNLGFGYGIIRFIGSSRNPVNLINSSFTVVALTSLAAVLIYVLGPGLWSPAVATMRESLAYVLIFALAVPAIALASLADNTFIGRRTAKFVLARNLIFNLMRLALPAALAAYLHSSGILASWAVAVLVSLLAVVFLFLPRVQPGYRLSPGLDRQTIGGMFRFSFANYLSDTCWSAPILIIQSILVVRVLGSESNAYFAVAWAMGSIMFTMVAAVSMSLVAEGSHDEGRLKQSAWQGLKMTFLVMTPAVLLISLLADRLLLIFGAHYAQNATPLLRFLAVSVFPICINSIYIGTKRVEKRMRVVIPLIVMAGAITIGLSCWLMPREGITGVGIAWLAGQCSITAVIVGRRLVLGRERPSDQAST